jgi:hypothetical protein
MTNSATCSAGRNHWAGSGATDGNDAAGYHAFSNGVVGVLYRHSIAGNSVTAIEAEVRNWLHDNLRAYGSSLGAIAVPAKSTKPSATPH